MATPGGHRGPPLQYLQNNLIFLGYRCDKG